MANMYINIHKNGKEYDIFYDSIVFYTFFLQSISRTSEALWIWMIDIFCYAAMLLFFLKHGRNQKQTQKARLWLIPKHFALYIYRILQARSGECPFLPVPDCPSRPIGQGGGFHVCSCAHMRVHKGSVALRPLILGTDKSGTGRSSKFTFKSMFCWIVNSWTPGWSKDTKSKGLKVFQTATTNTATWTGQVGQVHILRAFSLIQGMFVADIGGWLSSTLAEKAAVSGFPSGFLQQRGDHRLHWRISGYLFCFLWKWQHPTFGHSTKYWKILKPSKQTVPW